MWSETTRLFVESATNVLRATARVLPSLLAMILYLGLAALLAVAVRWAVRRACDRIRLDRWMRERGLSGAPGRDPRATSAVVARGGYWLVLLAGGCLALSVIDNPTAASLSARLIEYLPRLALSVVIVGAGIAASRYVGRSVLIGAVNLGLHSARMLALGARWLVLVLASAIALEHAGVGGGLVAAAFLVLFGGIVLALSLAVGLGARDLVARSLERRFAAGPPRQDPEDAPERGRVHHL